MPRKTKKIKGVEADSSSPENEREQASTEKQDGTQKESPKERNTNGQFAKGNSGGPGNPHARSCARMLQIFRDSFTDDEMNQIFRMLYVKAVSGDISAAKLVLAYKIGKPLPAPHPDSIDRDEWDHYQNDVMKKEEMQQVLSNFPSQVGNDIVRVSLPIMTAGRLNEFAEQLLKDSPKSKVPTASKKRKDDIETSVSHTETNDKAGEEVTTGDMKPSESTSPLSNGKLNGLANGRSTTRKRPSSSKQRSVNHSARLDNKAPIPNGKKKNDKKVTEKRKPEWLKPLAKKVMSK